MLVITEQSISVCIQTTYVNSLLLSPVTLSPSPKPAVFLFATLLLGFHRCISEPPASSVSAEGEGRVIGYCYCLQDTVKFFLVPSHIPDLSECECLHKPKGWRNGKKVHPADIPFRASMLFLSLFLTRCCLMSPQCVEM